MNKRNYTGHYNIIWEGGCVAGLLALCLPTQVIHNKGRRKLHHCKWSGQGKCSMSPPVISCLFLCRCCLTVRTSVGGGNHTITILRHSDWLPINAVLSQSHVVSWLDMCRVVVKHFQALHGSFLRFCPLHSTTSVSGLVPIAAVFATSLFFGQNIFAYSSIKKPLKSEFAETPKKNLFSLLNWCPVLTDVNVRWYEITFFRIILIMVDLLHFSQQKIDKKNML